jgi:phenylacetyl-CoA:acceptor oxidoreductase
MYYPDTVEDKMARFPFFVCIGYTHDETNHFADLILPDHTDLEGLQLIRIGPSVHSESIWKGIGFALRQPATEPVVNSIDLTDFATELAARVGILDEYYDALNAGLMLGLRLKGKNYNYELKSDKKYSREEIWDSLCRAATMILSEGKDDHGLEWFKENGYYSIHYPYIRHFLHPVIVRWGLRYEIPYQENIMKIGEELGARLHENKMNWWDHQLKEYEALPKCEDYTQIWEEEVRKAGAKPKDYNFWLVNTRSMQYAWGSNAAIPMMAEVAKNVAGFKGAIINSTRAKKMKIKENDTISIESIDGKVKARAILREGVRPDTVVFTGQFGHWKTPFAKDLGIPNLNTVAIPSSSTLDAGGSSADIVKVKIRRVR